jgi:4-amino-4-deoxy-L-arabinose transferase-like glycosyltransferase
MFDAEAITAITDYALAAASLLFAIAIGRSIGPHNRVSAWFWCAAFIAAAVAGTAGGTFHFLDSRNQDARQPLWTLVIVSMGAFGAFVTAGIHAAYVQRKDGTIRWLVAGMAVTLIGAAVQRLRLPQSASIDQNGLYHLIQIVGLYLFYRCALTVHDRPGVLPKHLGAQPKSREAQSSHARIR